MGTRAGVELRRGHGVSGGSSLRVAMVRGASSFGLRARHYVVATAAGSLYRIGAWLRSDDPGLMICLRIQELSPRTSEPPVRTSESCVASTASWRHIRVFRRTMAPGNRLVFSIYSSSNVTGDSFEIDRFRVQVRVKHGWKRVHAAFGNAPALGY